MGSTNHIQPVVAAPLPRKRLGDWIQTVSGRKVYPFDVLPEDLDISDIAHSLAQLVRFCGHAREPYTVAQHSLLVCDTVVSLGGTPDERLWALLHDAAEAYLGEVTTPVKRSLRMFNGNHPTPLDVAEQNILHVVAERWGLPWPIPQIVHHADRVALATEVRDFYSPCLDNWNLGLPAPIETVTQVAWPFFMARNVFLCRFDDLLRTRRAGAA